MGSDADIASLATARRGLGVPRSSVDALQRLEDAGAIPAGTTTRFTPIPPSSASQSRSASVRPHRSQIVYQVLTSRRDDLADLARLLADAVPAND